jgi:hypothetical protein
VQVRTMTMARVSITRNHRRATMTSVETAR